MSTPLSADRPKTVWKQNSAESQSLDRTRGIASLPIHRIKRKIGPTLIFRV